MNATTLSPNLRAVSQPNSRPVPHPSDIWLVIAAYNEGERLHSTLARVSELPYNVVVVDDGSRDHTSDVALRHKVWVLRHQINLGQGAALQTGIDFALKQGAQVVVTFDADGQHCTEDLPAVLEPILQGQVDVVLGSRFRGQTIGLPWSRWLILKLGVLFTRIVSNIRVTDTHNGFRAFSRSAAQRIRITQDRMAHASEILDRLAQEQISFCEVPVTIRYSEETMRKGQSSWNAVKIVAELLLGRMIP